MNEQLIVNDAAAGCSILLPNYAQLALFMGSLQSLPNIHSWIQLAVLHIFDGSTQAMSAQTWLTFSPGEPINNRKPWCLIVFLWARRKWVSCKLASLDSCNNRKETAEMAVWLTQHSLNSFTTVLLIYSLNDSIAPRNFLTSRSSSTNITGEQWGLCFSPSQGL